ncbi:MAG: D-alanyl-D-alanine carboxypeptidase family protein [Firmicutes bacterium]|nr:D-alanyl-D-alanine carboxypeptidase family protein [Bacillota bacterium]
MAKKKKMKLKKSVIYTFLIIVVIGVIGTIYGKQKYDEYKYKKTIEYKLIEKGWTKEQALELQKLYKDHINDILKRRTNENLIKIAKEKYFLYKNLDDYLEYIKENDDKSLTDVVAIINTHANNDWYSLDYDTDTSLNERLIVNKFYHLNEDYAPDDIVNISNKYAYDNNKMRQIAYDAFKDLWDNAYSDGIKLIINSSYRDYDKQLKIYEDYKNWYGQIKADQQAARPGYSEHQTGLAIDVFSTDNQLTGSFQESEGYKWLKDNAYKYGFIERYPEGKQYITGYEFESWHWRYVGIEAASVIHNENITYDEYYAYYIEK